MTVKRLLYALTAAVVGMCAFNSLGACGNGPKVSIVVKHFFQSNQTADETQDLKPAEKIEICLDEKCIECKGNVFQE